MNILNSSVIILLSASLAIPQHNHGDSIENTTAPVEPISTSSEVISIPVDTPSSTEDADNTPNNTASSSESKESKPEDRFLGLGFLQGLANVDVANVGRVQGDVPGIGGTQSVKADILGVGIAENLGGYGYYYPQYYNPFYSSFYPSFYPPFYPPQPFQPSQPSQLTQPTYPPQPPQPSFLPAHTVSYQAL